MRKVDLPLKLVDFKFEHPTVNAWFLAVTNRMNVETAVGVPTTGVIPTGQWEIYKDTSTNLVTLSVNDNGVLKNAEIPGVSSTNPSFTGNITLTGVVKPGKGPIVFAEASVATSIPPSVYTKVTLGNEIIDTDAAFDPSTSKFLPLTAGYYWVQGSVTLDFIAVPGVASVLAGIFKNGTVNIQQEIVTSASASGFSVSAGCMVFLNGSTDFIELFCFQTSAAKNTMTGANTFFSAALIRAT